MSITRNLYHGLRRISARPAGVKGGLIWIDAVCIDQTNIQERNAQVAKMAEIYSNAADVLVWLGEDSGQAQSDSIAVALECLNQPKRRHFREHSVTLKDGKIASVCLAHAAVSASMALENSTPPPGQGWEFEPVAEDFEERVPSRIRELFDLKELELAIKETQKILHTFLGRRYWCRRWVIQEIHNAQHGVQLLWAGHEAPLWQLEDTLELALRVDWSMIGEFFGYDVADEEEHRSYRTVAGPISLLNRSQHRELGQSTVLAQQLSIFYHSDCSDPRDRLYALLSLDPETRLQPDYSLSTDQVYMAYFVELLEAGHCLQTLLDTAARNRSSLAELKNDFATPYPDLWCASPGPPDEVAASLPSWCFDLRKQFLLPKRSTALSPWSVDSERHLTCRALVVGSLYSDLKGGFGGITSGPDLLSTSESLGLDVEPVSRLRIVWQAIGTPNYARPGDLACFFENLDEKLCSNINLHSIIVRPLSHGMARIVTYQLVRPELHMWNPSKVATLSMMRCSICRTCKSERATLTIGGRSAYAKRDPAQRRGRTMPSLCRA